MSKRWQIELKCVTCSETRVREFDTKKEYMAFEIPNPYYCNKHNPALLHGTELLDFCHGLLGIKWFGLKMFKRYYSYSQGIAEITHFESDQTLSYYSDGNASADINWTRVYSLSGGDRYWNPPEELRQLHPATYEEIAEIIAICEKQIKTGYFGFNTQKAKDNYERIALEVASTPDLMILS